MFPGLLRNRGHDQVSGMNSGADVSGANGLRGNGNGGNSDDDDDVVIELTR